MIVVRSLLLFVFCCAYFARNVSCIARAPGSQHVNVTVVGEAKSPPGVTEPFKSSCRDELCEQDEFCHVEVDPESGAKLAVCKCKEFGTGCDRETVRDIDVSINVSSFENLSKRQMVRPCSINCSDFEECLTIMGYDICFARRICDKESKPCHNGGNCVDISNRESRCVCPPNFDGDLCEIDMTVCDETRPCKNGGECQVINMNSICNCRDGYIQPRCEKVKENYCETSNPCKAGTCHNGTSWETLYCECPPGLTGPRCEVKFNPCVNATCGEGRICVPRRIANASTYDCVYATNPCQPNPCKGDCQCKASCKHENGYVCLGTSGLLGRNCDIPAPEIICGADVISVDVDSRLVDEYSTGNSDFSMFMAHSHSMSSSDMCPAVDNGTHHKFLVPLPFTKCGVAVSQSGDNTMVSGRIWLNKIVGSAEMAIPVVHFVCEYQRQYRIVTSLVPATDTVPTVTRRGLRLGVGLIDVCKSGSYCPGDCPDQFSLNDGAVYTVNEKMHLRVLPRTQLSAIRLVRLFLSCSNDSTRPSALELISGGCYTKASSQYLSTTAASSGGGVCLSFRVPHLTACDKFYIHATLEDCFLNCDAPYRRCGARKKRSSLDSVSGHVFGPIFVLDIRDGILHEISYSDEDDTSKLQEDPVIQDDSQRLATSIFVIFILVVVIVATSLAGRSSSRRCFKVFK